MSAILNRSACARLACAFVLMTPGLYAMSRMEQPGQPTKLAHVPTAVSSVSLNDNGWAVWTTGRGRDSQLYLWNGSKVLEMGFAGRNNRDASINQKNQIVWAADREKQAASDIYLREGTGKPVCLTASLRGAAQPALNDRGDVICWGDEEGRNQGIADVFYLAHNARKPRNLTEFDREGGSAAPKINNNGVISWERTTEKTPGGETNLLTATVAQPRRYRQVTQSKDLNIFNGGVDDSGKLVWRDYNDSRKKWDVFRYDPASRKVTNLSLKLNGNSHTPVIRNDGMVAWCHDTGKGTELYRDRGAGPERIPVKPTGRFNRPMALNQKGDLLFVSGDGSGTGYDILLAQPDSSTTAVVHEPSGNRGFWLAVTLGLLSLTTVLFRLPGAGPFSVGRVLLIIKP